MTTPPAVFDLLGPERSRRPCSIHPRAAQTLGGRYAIDKYATWHIYVRSHSLEAGKNMKREGNA